MIWHFRVFIDSKIPGPTRCNSVANPKLFELERGARFLSIPLQKEIIKIIPISEIVN